MIKFLKNNFYLILLISISLFIFIPTFNIKFSWIDDGWDILVAKNLISDLMHLDLMSIAGRIVETSIGRFRPMYWLWQTAVYIIGGSYSSVHYFLHYLLILSITILIYKTIYYFTKSNLSSFVGALLFITFPLNAENWIRLGPAEPIMLLFVLISVYTFLTSGNIRKSLIFIVFAFLTKETAIAIIPAFILYYVLLLVTKNKIKNIFYFIKYLIIFSMISIIISLLNRKGYSNSYIFNIDTARYNFELYLKFIQQVFPVITLFVGMLFLRNLRPIVNFKFSKIKKLEVTKILFLLLAISFILIQSPWAWVLTRYLLPAIAMGTVFVGLEFYSISLFFEKYPSLNKLFKTVCFIAFTMYVTGSVIKINEQIIRQRHSTNNIFLMLKRISDISPENSKVYFNFTDNDATMEPLFESGLHLKLFFGRQDINVEFIENIKINETDFIVISGTPTPLDMFKYSNDNALLSSKELKKSETFSNTDKFLVISDFSTITKQFVKKFFRFVTNQEKIDGSGIYTDYLLKDTWSLYYY